MLVFYAKVSSSGDLLGSQVLLPEKVKSATSEVMYGDLISGYQRLNDLASGGDIHASYVLGILYYEGYISKKNMDSSKRFLQFSFENGLAEAGFAILELHLSNPDSSYYNLAEAIDTGLTLMDSGEHRAAELITYIAVAKERESMTIEHWRKLVEWLSFSKGLNSPKSYFLSYFINKDYLGIDRLDDLIYAAENEWFYQYRLDSLQDIALLELANYYKGKEHDPYDKNSKYRLYLKRAAALNNGLAFYELGKLEILKNNVMKPDYKAAIVYFESAKSRGVNVAKYHIDSLKGMLDRYNSLDEFSNSPKAKKEYVDFLFRPSSLAISPSQKSNFKYREQSTTCNAISNNYIKCDNGAGYMTDGNLIIGTPDSSATIIGKSAFKTDGQFSTTIRNFTFGSDGSNCIKIGFFVDCKD